MVFQEDKLSKLRGTLSKRSKEQRRIIVNQKVNGTTPLFTACQQGKLHFVNYLLDECDANIELKGYTLTMFLICSSYKPTYKASHLLSQ